MTLVALVSVLLVLLSFSINTTTHTQAQCLPDQRHALIQLKKDFSTTELHSWNASTNCCTWDGITCDQQTGMVTAVELFNRSLSGEINPALFHLSSLLNLNLAGNHFKNLILPQTGFERLDNLTYLDLSNSGFAGQVPISISALKNIINLNLSHNLFTKIEGDGHFNGLSSLEVLDIHCNRISGHVPLLPLRLQYVDFSSNNFFFLPAHFVSSSVYLSLSKNNLTGEIPLSICNATFVDIRNALLPTYSFPPRPQVLDLSYNKLTGTIPPCLLENDALEVLNLRSNKLSGPLSQNFSLECKFRTIDLSANRVNGSLPKSLMNCNNLEVLDLRNNQIVDRFPFWLGNLKNLRVLVLRSNKFYGNISKMEVKMKANDSFFPTLKVFDLSSNDFRGIIPNLLFEEMKAMVTSDALSPLFTGKYGYEYTDKYGYEYNYQNSITVIWKGGDMEITNSLNIFSSLDLSQNGFSGEIPEEIGHLKSLVGLNLSHNALTGSIPSEISKLQQLQSLDLSCNKLFGPIPQELTSLHFLSALNLSYNNLVGEIPQVPQLSTFSNASYLGNPGLCGSPLSMHCATPSNDEFNKDLPSNSSSDIIGLSVSIGLGLGAGFVSVIWVLISWENGRELFNFIVDRFYFRHILWIVLHLRLAIGREQ